MYSKLLTISPFEIIIYKLKLLGDVMKSKLSLAVAFFITTSNAIAFNDDPNEMFSTNNNYTDNSAIRWVAVDNVQQVCDLESKKRGYGGISWSVKACSFYNANKCDIYTAKRLNMHTLGHEIRHCFQGNFHN